MFRAAVVASLLIEAGCGRLRFDPSGAEGTDGDGGLLSDARTGDGFGDDVAGDSSTDGSGVAPDSCLSHTGAVICDGFEGVFSWTTVDVVCGYTGQPHTGVSNLMCHSPGSPNGSGIERTVAAITNAPQFYVRAWMYLYSSDMYTDVVLLDVKSGNGQGVFVSALNGSARLSYNTPATGVMTGPAFPLDRWMCLELAVTANDTTGAFVLSLDGVAVITQSAIDARPSGGYDRLQIGVPVTQQAAGAGVNLDDIVIDVAPIGCNP